MQNSERAWHQYNYDQVEDEFVENPTGVETGNITGNRVFVTTEIDGTKRFRVEIDGFGDVIGAMNRLIKRLVPTFIFPNTQKPPYRLDDDFLPKEKYYDAS